MARPAVQATMAVRLAGAQPRRRKRRLPSHARFEKKRPPATVKSAAGYLSHFLRTSNRASFNWESFAGLRLGSFVGARIIQHEPDRLTNADARMIDRIELNIQTAVYPIPVQMGYQANALFATINGVAQRDSGAAHR